MRKKTNISGFGVEQFLVNMANKTITLHPIKREWKTAINILILFRITTAVISIFAAYFFFKKYVSLVIPNAFLIPIITFILLIVVEFLSNQFTSKFFKFAFRKRTKTALSVLPVVIIFYGVSFISSTNGLANYANQKIVSSVNIDSVYNSFVDSLNNVRNQQILTYQTAIQEIRNNPQGWQNGHRIVLLDYQLADINEYLQKIDETNTYFDKRITEVNRQRQLNKQELANIGKQTAKDYYKFVSFVMFFQLLVTGLLTYFLYLIRTQEHTDHIISENLNYIKETVSNNAYNAAEASVIAANNRFSELLQNALNKHFFFKDYVQIEQTNSIQTDPENTQKKPIGFNQDTPPKNTDEKISETSTHTDDTAEFKNIKLEYLLKHKKIISAIRKLNIPEKEYLSNSEVKNIQDAARNAKFKSATTIRNVYNTIKTLGISNFDESGNFRTPTI
jgi:hypothetical protein